MSDFLKAVVKFDYEEYGKRWENKIRELEFLCSTFEGTCPGDREFGLNPDVVDENPITAQTDYVMEVTEKMAKYMPSLELIDIDFEYTDDGILYPTLYVEPVDEEDLEDEEE